MHVCVCVDRELPDGIRLEVGMVKASGPLGKNLLWNVRRCPHLAPSL